MAHRPAPHASGRSGRVPTRPRQGRDPTAQPHLRGPAAGRVVARGSLCTPRARPSCLKVPQGGARVSAIDLPRLDRRSPAGATETSTCVASSLVECHRTLDGGPPAVTHPTLSRPPMKSLSATLRCGEVGRRHRRHLSMMPISGECVLFGSCHRGGFPASLLRPTKSARSSQGLMITR